MMARRPIFESSGGMPISDGGMSNSFCDPCINKRSAERMRSRLNMRGAQAPSVSVIIKLHRSKEEHYNDVRQGCSASRPGCARPADRGLWIRQILQLAVR